MSLITPDVERFSPAEEKEIWDALSFGAWALKHGCSVEYVVDQTLGTEIAIIHDPDAA